MARLFYCTLLLKINDMCFEVIKTIHNKNAKALTLYSVILLCSYFIENYYF